MPRSIFSQSFRDLEKPVVICTAGLMIYSLAVLAFYPVLTAYPDFGGWVQQSMQVFQKLAGIAEPVTTPVGFLNTAFFALILPAALAGFSILSIDRIFNREHEAGNLDMLLARPLPRWRLGLHKFAALALAAALMAGVLWGVYAWRITALGLPVNLLHLAGIMVCVTLMGLCFGSLAMVFGALTGRARLSRGLAWLGLALTYAFFLAPQLAPELKFVRLLSPFWYLLGDDPLINGVSLLHAAALVMLTGLTLAAALVIFEQRDLT